MQVLTCIPLEKQHLDFVCKTSNLDTKKDLKRLIDDYENSYFNGVVCKVGNNNDDCYSNMIYGYAIYYYSYSTFEGRVIYVADIYLENENKNVQLIEFIFTTISYYLVSLARSKNCKRVNYNRSIFSQSNIEDLFINHVGALNLTKSEQWHFFRMDLNQLKSFAQIDNEKFSIKLENTEIVLRKINVDTDSDKVCELIYQMSVFEKISDQFKMKPIDFKNDIYKHNDGFYECFVAENKETKEIISYALYFYMYSLRLGRGAYLEDLFVKEEFRHHGIGTLMWRKLAHDVLFNHALYLEWNCLEWNTIAIDFYLKNNAYNTTIKENVNLLRIKRENIYKEQ